MIYEDIKKVESILVSINLIDKIKKNNLTNNLKNRLYEDLINIELEYMKIEKEEEVKKDEWLSYCMKKDLDNLEDELLEEIGIIKTNIDKYFDPFFNPYGDIK